MNNLGFVYALIAYFIWGVVPIFWRWIAHVDSVEIVAHRMVWSFVLALLLTLVLRQWRVFLPILKQRKVMARLFIASMLISVNWGVYIWAINDGRIVEGSMGYYINPLLNVFVGMLVFGETLRPNQWLAIGLAAVGVAYLIFVHGEIPYVALILAVTFSAYGAVKKSLEVPAVHGMVVETGMVLIPACVYLSYLSMDGSLAFGGDMRTDVLLILGGAVTLAPLLFFAAAAQRISLTALGMTQYLGPTLQLIIGVFMYNEPFGSERQIAFGCIWVALLIYSVDQINNRRRRRKVADNAAGVVVKVEQ